MTLWFYLADDAQVVTNSDLCMCLTMTETPPICSAGLHASIRATQKRGNHQLIESSYAVWCEPSSMRLSYHTQDGHDNHEHERSYAVHLQHTEHRPGWGQKMKEDSHRPGGG